MHRDNVNIFLKENKCDKLKNIRGRLLFIPEFFLQFFNIIDIYNLLPTYFLD